MQKLRFFFIAAAVAGAAGLVGCRKDPARVTTVREVSYPTITFTGPRYFSIEVGGSLPSVAATAYDSLLRERYDVALAGTDALDASTPGLYIISARAVNKYGFSTNEAVYVAVTNVPEASDLSGTYERTSNGEPAEVTKLARGLYQTDDVGGSPTFQIPALFVHIDDSTMQVPLQPTEAGDLDCTGEQLDVSDPVTFSYIVDNANFGTARRTFVKQ